MADCPPHLKPPTNIYHCLYCAETGGERVQADHTRHIGGEDNGSTEVQDEHRQHCHQPRQRQPAEHGHRPAPQPLHSRQGETSKCF